MQITNLEESEIERFCNEFNKIQDESKNEDDILAYYEFDVYWPELVDGTNLTRKLNFQNTLECHVRSEKISQNKEVPIIKPKVNHTMYVDNFWEIVPVIKDWKPTELLR